MLSILFCPFDKENLPQSYKLSRLIRELLLKKLVIEELIFPSQFHTGDGVFLNSIATTKSSVER